MKAKRKARRKNPPKGMTRFFLRGLLILLPVLLTVVVFGLVFQMVDRYVTGPINSVIYWSLEDNALGWKVLERFNIDPFSTEFIAVEHLPIELKNLDYTQPDSLNALRNYRYERLSFFRDLDELCIDRDDLRDAVHVIVHPVVGFILSFLIVLWLGWLVGSFVGRRLVQKLDEAMHKIPVVKSVYPYSKQLVEFFLAEKEVEFDRVVSAPYPSEGMWSIGFVTNDGLKTLRAETGEKLISVFIPSSPMPMTGYTIFIPENKLIPLPISVDEALRITMTGGVLVPAHEQVEVSALPEEEEERDA